MPRSMEIDLENSWQQKNKIYAKNLKNIQN